jgi:flagellar biosynthesis protein FlhB
MAENKDGQEKSEQATPKRIGDARMRGQVSKSMDVTTSAMMLVGGIIVFILGKPLIENFQKFMAQIFTDITYIRVDYDNVGQYYAQLISFLGQLLLPIILIIFAIAFIAEVSQIGLKITPKKFTEGGNLKKVFNPFSGLKRIFFSGRSAFELLKSLMKIFILGIVVYWVLSDKMEETVLLIERPFYVFADFMVQVSLELLIKVGVVYIIIAVIDSIYQKKRHKKDLMMTKQEIKDEQKQTLGDPLIKGKIRSLMRNRIRQIMMSNVEKSDVVITNPTHFAVALMYKPGQSNAPVVVAKGVDFLAIKIKEIAKEKGVTIVEQPPLARSLYYSVQINSEIPENLFKAVAEVLAYVYQLKEKRKNSFSNRIKSMAN